ncbi:hypothetical protein C8R45DRAFT_938201 [Mycena sanguinolenta]|nr:hypothetical protein C8R45DRAFT_938201 [Mycena sanguinolenta]
MKDKYLEGGGLARAVDSGSDPEIAHPLLGVQEATYMSSLDFLAGLFKNTYYYRPSRRWPIQTFHRLQDFPGFANRDRASIPIGARDLSTSGCGTIYSKYVTQLFSDGQINQQRVTAGTRPCFLPRRAAPASSAVGDMGDLASTLGVLLFGGAIGLLLLDFLHSAFIVIALYDYCINFFADTTRLEDIPWSVAASVVVTATQTVIVHWYFAHKIYKSSGQNWFITGLIVLLAFLRFVAATVGLHNGPVALSPRGYYHHGVIMLSPPKNAPANSRLYSWLAMPKNLVFMGLHFIIAKPPTLTVRNLSIAHNQTYPYGFATSSLNMSSPSAAYRPAFKVNPRTLPSEIDVSMAGHRTVKRNSFDSSEYSYGRRQPRSPRDFSDYLRSLP